MSNSGDQLRALRRRRWRLVYRAALLVMWVLATPLCADDLELPAGEPAAEGLLAPSDALIGETGASTTGADDVESRLRQLETDLQLYRDENQSLRSEINWLNSRVQTNLGPVPSSEGESQIPLTAYWDRQLRFESRDGNWVFHVGGGLQWDSVWLIGPESVFALPGGGVNGATNNAATLIRRARFRFDGSIYQQIDYVLEFDLANAVNENKGLQDPSLDNIATSPAPKNVWVQIRDFYCLGNVRIGQQKKPIGLENNTSHSFLPFLERSYNMDAFYGPFDSGYTTGVMSINRLESGRMTWRYGLFRPLENTFGVAIENWQVAGRATALPVYVYDGERLIHVGLGALLGDLVQDERRFRARPVLRNGPGYAVPIMVDTGDIPAHNHIQLCPEFAAVAGPFTLQAEYAAEWLNVVTVANPGQNTAFFHGGYCEALYFLTGEHQAYDFDTASFGRVVPRHNLRIRNGYGEACGAWQAGVRFSYLDLNDRSIRGGQVYDWTLGLNWFLNPNTKIQFNYMLLHRDGQQNVAEGWINGLGTRVAVDF